MFLMRYRWLRQLWKFPCFFFFSFFSMKIVKEHNEMTTALDEKKKSLMEQLDMV